MSQPFLRALQAIRNLSVIDFEGEHDRHVEELGSLEDAYWLGVEDAMKAARAIAQEGIDRGLEITK